MSENDESDPLASIPGDARELLAYAIERGVQVTPEDIETIDRSHGNEIIGPKIIGPKLLEAYARVSELVAPVTVHTLRATDSDDGTRCEAERWSIVLWGVTVACLGLIFTSGTIASFDSVTRPIDTTPDTVVFAQSNWKNFASLAEFCFPFWFGALGACAYLLRTCDRLYYLRTFDPRRKPEYINRILLGLVSGGAGGLFLSWYLTSSGEIGINLSASAVGFLCGYNTDLLFRALERLAEAILPKVSPPSVDSQTPETAAKAAKAAKPK